MTLGQRISRYRKELGISQEALGERLGVSRQAVSKWETDAAAPDMTNLMALAREPPIRPSPTIPISMIPPLSFVSYRSDEVYRFHHVGEVRRCQRLCAVAKRTCRIVVDFNHKSVCSCSCSGHCHRLDEVCDTGGMTRVYYYRQMCHCLEKRY